MCFRLKCKYGSFKGFQPFSMEIVVGATTYIKIVSGKETVEVPFELTNGVWCIASGAGTGQSIHCAILGLIDLFNMPHFRFFPVISYAKNGFPGEDYFDDAHFLGSFHKLRPDVQMLDKIWVSREITIHLSSFGEPKSEMCAFVNGEVYLMFNDQRKFIFLSWVAEKKPGKPQSIKKWSEAGFIIPAREKPIQSDAKNDNIEYYLRRIDEQRARGKRVLTFLPRSVNDEMLDRLAQIEGFVVEKPENSSSCAKISW